MSDESVQNEESAPSIKAWYSIKEAAEYLSIGKPTLYRWMRDGKITFRKVGDSTRFVKEDLDAMIQVHRSAKEVSQVKQVCPLCHSNDLISGSVQSTGNLYFKPENTKFWTLRDSNVKTHTLMCARCGYLMTFGDVNKLSALRESKDSLEGGVSEHA